MGFYEAGNQIAVSAIVSRQLDPNKRSHEEKNEKSDPERNRYDKGEDGQPHSNGGV